jgi:DNA topoisomerase-1
MMHEFYDKFVGWVQEARTADAPPASDAKALIDLFAGVEYAPARKVGRRTYDDGDFVKSVREKFEADGKISARQYTALINLAARYFDRLSDQSLLALPDAIRDTVASEAEALKERTAAQEVAAEQAKAIDYSGLFASFSDVKWDEPVKRGRVTYDDKKFFDSLKKQALAGKLLSDRQNAALAKMAKRYQGQLKDAALVFSILNIENESAEDTENTGKTAETVSVPDVSAGELIAALSKVTSWEEQVKRGRFSFDDKKFFQSVKKQFDSGKVLSPKQITALGKLAAKYGAKENE